MKRIASATLLAVASLALPGCASIVSGQNQSVSVSTRDDNGELAGASCTLNNDKGTWYVKTPASVTVRRSFADMSAKCDVDLYESAMQSTKSSTKAMAFGNVLFGGVIGAGVDVATGAAYDYPEVIVIKMVKVGVKPAVQPEAKPAEPAAVANK
jgi:hypothetical protein